jgi:hypothetical protein
VLGGHRVVVALDEGDPASSELDHRVVATRLGQEPQRLRGEVVVLLVELVATCLSEHELASRTPPSTLAVHRAIAALDHRKFAEMVEVPAYGGCSQLQTLRQFGCRGRAVLQDRPRDPVTGRSVARGRLIRSLVQLHKPSVTLLRLPFQQR